MRAKIKKGTHCCIFFGSWNWDKIDHRKEKSGGQCFQFIWTVNWILDLRYFHDTWWRVLLTLQISQYPWFPGLIPVKWSWFIHRHLITRSTLLALCSNVQRSQLVCGRNVSCYWRLNSNQGSGTQLTNDTTVFTEKRFNLKCNQM